MCLFLALTEEPIRLVLCYHSTQGLCRWFRCASLVLHVRVSLSVFLDGMRGHQAEHTHTHTHTLRLNSLSIVCLHWYMPWSGGAQNERSDKSARPQLVLTEPITPFPCYSRKSGWRALRLGELQAPPPTSDDFPSHSGWVKRTLVRQRPYSLFTKGLKLKNL